MGENLGYGIIAIVMIAIVLIAVLFMIYYNQNSGGGSGGSGVGFWGDGRKLVSGTGGTMRTNGTGASDHLISVYLIKAKTSGVDLGISNNVEEDLTLKSVQVTNCGIVYPGRVLIQKQSADFSVPCLLEPGKFSGNILISYYQTGSMNELTFEGAINPTIA